MIKKAMLVIVLCGLSTQTQAGITDTARRAVKATIKTGYEHVVVIGAIGYTVYVTVDKINHPNNDTWPWTVLNGLLGGAFTGCAVRFVGDGLMIPITQEIVKSWKRNFKESS